MIDWWIQEECILKFGPFCLTPSDEFIEMMENATCLEESETRQLKLIEKVCLGIHILSAEVRKT
jgi:hypothetical protein